MPYSDPVKRAECDRRYRDANRERIRVRNQKYYKEHRDEQHVYQAEYRSQNREKLREYQVQYRAQHKAEARAKDLRRKYGLTPEQYDAMLAAQGGHCAICPATEPGGAGKMFHVDHDHRTGRVRGLLCHACNTVLTEHLEKHITAIASYLAAAGLKNLLLDRFESSDNLPDIPNGGNPPGAEDERADQGEVRDV